MEKLDLQVLGLRALNERLQSQTDETNQKDWEIINPRGSHAIAVGVDAIYCLGCFYVGLCSHWLYIS